MSSQHSRKSSLIAKEINDSQRSNTQKSIRQVLDNENADDQNGESNNIDNLVIKVDIQPIELTKKEEQNNADFGKIQGDAKTNDQNQAPGPPLNLTSESV